MNWTWWVSLPWIFKLVLVIIVVIILAIIVSALGGAGFDIFMGHFFWHVGVTKGA